MAVFQARARTVDMLGHQQVTDIATAISELFKNAHDAYATEVVIDYLRQEDLLVVHDDGIGMSPDQFEERWLTLAADSGTERSDAPKAPEGMATRPIQGEKGIGRLAIATIGPQVLVLTRPLAGGELTAALINWPLFAVPGINLGDVEIPTRTFAEGGHPTEAELTSMVEESRATLKKLKIPKIAKEVVRGHLKQIDRDLDPAGLLQAISRSPLTAGGHGTVFFVTPTEPELVDDLDEIKKETDPPPGLLKTLIGFSNTMVPGAEPPRIKTVFRDHRGADDVDEAIGPQEFFTPREFKEADHTFSGEFDAFGCFEGKVSIYGSKPKPYPWTWRKSGGREVRCGPFRLSVAYVQGKPNESRLEKKMYAAIEEKLKKFGGLYVYRDGIRVLPYGDPTVDFLEFEERRSKHFSRNFFSYRRMFGAIELDGENNAELREKAGREGFRNNHAYRDFTELLKDFFVQIAAEYFDAKGTRSDDFQRGKEREKERHRLLSERQEAAEGRRKELAGRLSASLSAIDDEKPRADAEALLRRIGAEAGKTSGSKGTQESRLSEIELKAFDELETLRAAYEFEAPAGIGLDIDLRRDIEALQSASSELEMEVWGPAAEAISRVVSEARDAIGVESDRRGRLTELVDAAAERREAEARERSVAAKASLKAFDSDAEQAIGSLLDSVEDAAVAARKAAGNGGGPVDSEKDLNRRRQRIESELAAETRDQIVRLEVLGELLADGLTALGGVEGPRASLAAMYEEEIVDLRDRAEQDLELAQIGMATQVISHELNTTVRSVRDGLRRLSAWSEQNEALRNLYEDLRGSFDHLDAYLSLFTPLQRRLRRKRERLNGRGVEEYIGELFERRLEKEQIELKTTKGFHEWNASGFRSDLYPALVNLVDNAIFWVGDSEAPRWIELDAAEGDLIVADSGPGVPTRDRDAIWEFGFTRKPRGRGAGLHIVREVLDREGWSIKLEKPRKGRGAVFRISPPK